MFLAPDAAFDDGALDVVTVPRVDQGALPARCCRGSSRARTSHDAEVDVLRGAEVRVERRPAVRGLRRRRPDRRAARRRSAAVPRAPCGCSLPRMRRRLEGGRRPRRRAPRRGWPAAAARRCPARSLLRLDPHAIRALSARLPRRQRGASPRPTARRRPPRWSPRSSSAAARRLVPQPRRARTWPAASPPRCWTAQRRHRACSRSTSSGWTGRRRAASPRALLLANLFRDQLDRYGELETIADRWAGVVARRPAARRSCSTPTTRSSPTSAATAPTPCYFGVEDTAMAMPGLQHAADSKHCRRCGAPYVYDAVFLGHLGHYHCPTGDARRPGARVAATRHRARRHRAARASRCARRTARRRVALPLPGLYNVYNALGRRGAGARARRAAGRTSSPGWQAVAAAFGRAETVARRRRATCRSCSSRTRPGPTRSCARSRSRTASTTCSPCSTTASPTAATSRGCGTPTSSCSPGRLRRVDVRGHARRGDGAAAEVRRACPADRIAVEPRSWPPRWTARSRRAAAAPAPLFALPTYTAMLALREELVRARRRRELVRMSAADREVALARPRVRRLRARTCRCGASWPREAGGPGARRRRRAPAGSRSTSPRAATRSSRWTSTPSRCCARCAARARRRRLDVRPWSADARELRRSPAASARSSCRCRRCSCSAARRAARAFLAARARAPAPGRAARRRAGRRAGGLRRRAHRAAAARHPRGRRHRLRLAARSPSARPRTR